MDVKKEEHAETQISNLFDQTRPIQIKLQTPEGVKTIDLRFPTDDELGDRQRRRKIIIKSIGRGMTETTVLDSEEIDAELVKKIRSSEDPEIDPYEATQVINQLIEAEVDEVEREGGGYRVFLRVPGARTEHVVKMPSAKEIIKYRRKANRVIDLRHNKQQLVIDPTPAIKLYDSLKVDVQGYEGEIPSIHKAAVINAAIEEMESGTGVAGAENF